MQSPNTVEGDTSGEGAGFTLRLNASARSSGLTVLRDGCENFDSEDVNSLRAKSVAEFEGKHCGIRFEKFALSRLFRSFKSAQFWGCNIIGPRFGNERIWFNSSGVKLTRVCGMKRRRSLYLGTKDSEITVAGTYSPIFLKSCFSSQM